LSLSSRVRAHNNSCSSDQFTLSPFAMKPSLLLLLVIGCSYPGLAQDVAQDLAPQAPSGASASGPSPTGLSVDPSLTRFTHHLRYADSHIHPTYKHYFRYRTADEMLRLLQGALYAPDRLVVQRLDAAGNVVDTVGCRQLIGFTPDVVAYFKQPSNSNWTPYAKLKERQLQRGRTSKLRNYDQAGYPEIQYVPGSVLCNSYSPYEKQLALKFFQRFASSVLVTGMGMSRLTTYAHMEHTPYNDFLAEYYYNLLQDEEKRVTTASPANLYTVAPPAYVPNPAYRNSIRMMHDAQDLAQCLQHNDAVFSSTGWPTAATEPLIYTPLVMSIEGAQVLYGPLSAANTHILNPLNAKAPGKLFKQASAAEIEQMRTEILENAVRLKNLPHRLFFITLGHFAQNHVVGFAKTLDRDPESVEHRAMQSLTKNPGMRKSLLRKTYAGFNPGCERTQDDCTPSPVGLDVVRAFLDPRNTIYHKPTYIDVKHMDIQGRIEYYYRRRELEQELNIKIPIIASHFGVSGEPQALAAATGLQPNFDKYPETEVPESYYRSHILRDDEPDQRALYWKNYMWGQNYGTLNGKKQALTPAEKHMYRPLDFTISRAQWLQDTAAFDPFEGFEPDPHKVGWYYPWSINLFDEEIIEINKSDGIIGLLLDPRQLGSFMPNYHNIEDKFGDSYRRIFDSLSPTELAAHYLTKEELKQTEYFKVEPMLRNWFYIVQVIKQQRANEVIYTSTGIRPPGFVPDPAMSSGPFKDAWETVNIGSDFDGLIDPIDYAPTAAYLPGLRRRLVAYAYIFAQIHPEFRDPVTKAPFLNSLTESDHRLEQLFYSNLTGFITRYF
jgi:hypothetical protein